METSLTSPVPLDPSYRHGFETEVESHTFPKGLAEGTVREISRLKGEPPFMLDLRLKALRYWQTQAPPTWAALRFAPLDFQDIRYYSAPKATKGGGPHSLAEVDQEVLRTFERLGIPLLEQKRLAGVAVDAVFDSVSVATTHQEELRKVGVIFCSLSEALREHPDLVQRYLGSVVPYRDNFYAALNTAVFSDGSFVYIPKGVTCPLDLSTYFRINARETGQFERTLIIADEGARVSYLEGCTAPMRDENQLHAAVVELVALRGASIKYSTVQNWYAGDAEGRGGIFNFVTKRGLCQGDDSRISWTQVETGSAITWKYPSVILKGDRSQGEFYSVALTQNKMQADTGTKMVHLGRDTKSRIVSKGISTHASSNTYRGLVKVGPDATGARNHTVCDSLLVGPQARAFTFPDIDVRHPSAIVEHEASTSRLHAEQLFYLASRGYDTEAAISLLLGGFCREVLKELPLEFAVEARRLLELKLEGSVG